MARTKILGRKRRKTRNPRSRKKLIDTKNRRRHLYHPIAHENARWDKEKAMKQFAALLRKDNQPVRYLVVDDSVFARKNIIKMVQLFGGEISGEAGDGLTAIAEYSRTKPGVVLMDITMPQMVGIEAVERIVRQHPEAKVVMVSSVVY